LLKNSAHTGRELTLEQSTECTAECLTADASRSERDSRRYHEKALIPIIDAAEWVFYTNKSGTTEVEAFVPYKIIRTKAFLVIQK